MDLKILQRRDQPPSENQLSKRRLAVVEFFKAGRCRHHRFYPDPPPKDTDKFPDQIAIDGKTPSRRRVVSQFGNDGCNPFHGLVSKAFDGDISSHSVTTPVSPPAQFPDPIDIMKLQQGQLWKKDGEYIRIVTWERLAIEYKSIPDLESGEGTLHRLSKKEFCRLVKGAELIDPVN